MLAEKQRAKQGFNESEEIPPPDLSQPQPRKEATIPKSISDEELLRLAQTIPATRFVEFGMELGFTPRAIDQLLMGGRDRGIFEMLMMWRDKTRGVEQKMELERALRSAGIGNLIEMLEDFPAPAPDPPKGINPHFKLT